MRIRRGLSSRLLPCGCLAGIYETYRDEIVMILDAKSADCADPTHLDGNIIPALTRENSSAAHHGPRN